MYLITAYFDDKTTAQLQKYIDRIAADTGNTFMIDHCVPPHLTVTSFDSRNEESVIHAFRDQLPQIPKGSTSIVSIGNFKGSVVYAAPVLNHILLNASKEFTDIASNLEDTKIRPCYQYLNWMPHITLGKTLTPEQTEVALQTMVRQFVPVTGEIVRFGLSKTGPDRNLREIL